MAETDGPAPAGPPPELPSSPGGGAPGASGGAGAPGAGSAAGGAGAPGGAGSSGRDGQLGWKASQRERIQERREQFQERREQFQERREQFQERWDDFGQAAIETEMETGRREETVEAAKRSLLKRTIRITAGLAVTSFGALLLVLPGPGLLVVAAGLVILAQDVPFAARLLDKVRARLPADADGRIPKGTVVLGLGISALAVGGSLWWTLLR